MAVGALTLLVIGPPIGVVVGSTVLWEAIDRGFKGGLVESNNELRGLLLGKIVPWFDRVTKPFNKRLVKHEEDSFLVNFAILMGFGRVVSDGVMTQLVTVTGVRLTSI